MSLTPAGRTASTAIAAVLLCSALTGCSSDSISTQPAPTTSSSTPAGAVGCADLTELESSLEALEAVDLRQGGVAGLDSAIADVKSALSTAKASASAALQPSLDQVQAAFSALQSAASDLSADKLVEKTPALAAALKQVATATSELTSTVAQDCPGS